MSKRNDFEPGDVDERLEERVRNMLAALPRVAAFRGIEVVRSIARADRGGLLLKLTIDRDGGVDAHLCEAVSRFITRWMEAQPPPVPPYQIEVSSPGVERPLLVPEHYRRFTGRRAKIITAIPVGSRTEFVGPIEAADDAQVIIADARAGLTTIPYEAIKLANLVFDPAEDLKKRR